MIKTQSEINALESSTSVLTDVVQVAPGSDVHRVTRIDRVKLEARREKKVNQRPGAKRLEL